MKSHSLLNKRKKWDFNWHSQGDSNPCYRRERAVS